MTLDSVSRFYERVPRAQSRPPERRRRRRTTRR
jgi:hypothetical protein